MSTTNLLIPRLPFVRLIRDILLRMYPGGEGIRWQRAALECIQEAAEAYLVSFLSDANLAAIHSRRVTLMPRDMHLIQRLRGPIG